MVHRIAICKNILLGTCCGCRVQIAAGEIREAGVRRGRERVRRRYVDRIRRERRRGRSGDREGRGEDKEGKNRRRGDTDTDRQADRPSPQ